MKIRNTRNLAEEKIELQMTPMIDIVFQLLVFFIMTFKIVSQEGDFNIKMPLQSDNAALPDDQQLLMKLRLTADAEGNLSGIILDEKQFPVDPQNPSLSFDQLHQHVRGLIGDESGPGSFRERAEVELDCDYQLKYSNVVSAITSVSGYVQDDSIIKLIEKIKFAAPKPPPLQ